jgi:hypothetical protein
LGEQNICQILDYEIWSFVVRAGAGVILDYEMWSFVGCMYVGVVVSVIWDEQWWGGAGGWGCGKNCTEEEIKKE